MDNEITMDYKDIPLEAIGNRVLEVGVSSRIMQTHLWPKISLGSYTGIDVVNRVKDENILIIEEDIRDHIFPENEKYDTIISVHTFEHINLWDWPAIFEKLKSVLAVGGKFILVLPHNQQFRGYPNFPKILLNLDRYQQHLVFGINQKMLRYFLPDCTIFRRNHFFWRQDGCSLVWAIGRFIRRILTRNFNPIRRNIYAIWEKK